MARKPKYNAKIVERICELIEKDSYTIPEICKMVGIVPSTYHDWMANKSEFSVAIKKAKDTFDEFIANEAKKSLVKLVQGYTMQEKHVVYVDSKDKDGNSRPKIKEQKIVDKHFQPSVPAVIFALINKDPDNWKNRQNTELTGKGGKDLIPARVLTKEEAKALLDQLNDEC